MGPELAAIKALNIKSLAPAGGAAALAAAGFGANKKNRSGSLLPVTKIPEGYMGMQMRFGRPIKRGKIARKLGREGDFHGLIEGGGWRFIPAHSIELFSIQERHNTLKGVATGKDGKQLEVESSIWWAIKPDEQSAYNALFKNENGELTESVLGFCATGLRQVIRENDRDKLSNKTAVDWLMKQACKEDLHDYGVKIIRSRLAVAERTLGQMMLESAHISGQHNSAMWALAIKSEPLAVANGQAHNNVETLDFKVS